MPVESRDETRTVHDPILDKDVQISDRLVDRLRGRYACGPMLPNGEPEFGWREFETPPIQHEAATRIESDAKRIAELEAERDKLRVIISASATAIGNGAMLSPECSIEFMEGLPEEISKYTDKLRRFLKCSRDEGGEALERADRAERALAEERERHQWRTIESAPKDGTSVLGYQNAPGDFEGQQDVCWQYGPKNNPIWIGSRGLMPTHWQPLPDATAIRSGKPDGKDSDPSS